MRTATLVISALLAFPVFAETAPTPAAAPSNVEVRFEKTDKFRDATYDNRRNTSEQVAKDIAAHMQKAGLRYLPAGQRLEVEITDIDLAGRYEPWHIQARDVRFMRDVAWPRIDLKYRLFEGDKEIAQGDDHMSDMTYLHRPGLATSGDRLRYEKAMIDQWFRARFAREDRSESKD